MPKVECELSSHKEYAKQGLEKGAILEFRTQKRFAET